MPQETPTFDRLRDICLVVLLVLAAGWNFAALRGYVFEDAYITFRYAANLAAGHGFVFQPGERVLGTSTPLFTLLLAFLGLLGADIPAAGRLLSALSLSACGFFGWRLLARRGAPNAGAFFAVVAVSGASGVFNLSGMETGLHLALVFLAAYLAAEERPVATGIVLGLACLNRYDGVMIAAAVLLTLAIRRRRLPWTEALICGGMLGGWLLFAQLYFGGPLPNTYAAKAADVNFATYATESLKIQVQSLPQPLYRLGPPEWRPWLFKAVALLLALPLLWRAGVLAASLPRRRPGPSDGPAAGGLDLAPLAFFAVFLWLGYSLVGPPLQHTWYLIPATWAFLALGLAAWGRLPFPPRFAAAATLLVVAGALVLLPGAARREAALITSVEYGNDRVTAYEEMARFVRHHGLEDSTLLTNEPGYLTYLSGQRAIDAAGLVTRDVYYHGPVERRSDPYRLLAERRPEMAMLGSLLVHEPGIAESYQLALAAAPGRNLWISRDFFRRHLDQLYAAWQKFDYRPGRPAELRHPFAIDFGVTDPPPFFQRGTSIGPLDAGPPESRGSLLHSRGQYGAAAAWSFPFAIDFDQLEFLFAGNHEYLTAAQLFVDGLLVYEVAGQPQPGGPHDLGPLEKIELPVYGWRGREGTLFFLSAEGESGLFAADQVASKVYSRRRVFDDFESGEYSPASWEKGFGPAPADTRQIAELGGLALVQGRFAATSLFAAGKQEMTSRPFLVDHSRLSFTVFDFGDGRTRVELRVGGQRKHFYAGRGRGRVDLVEWDVSRLLGQEAVLIVRDEAEAAEVGIGIDSILLHDD